MAEGLALRFIHTNGYYSTFRESGPVEEVTTEPVAPPLNVRDGSPAKSSGVNPALHDSALSPQFEEAPMLAILVANMFLVGTCISMLAPLLLELAAEFHVSVGTAGELSAAAPLPWALLAPVMGVISDRVGRRPVLAIGTMALGLMTMASATAWDYDSMLVLRFLSGVAGAASGPNIMASVVDYFPAHRRGRAMGMVLAGLSLATVAGVPLLAVGAAYLGWRATFVGFGLLIAILGAATWVVFPRMRRPSSGIGFFTGISSALAEKSTPPLLLANLLERLSFTAAITYLASFLMESYSLGLEQIAPILSATAGGTMLGSMIGGRLADRGRQVEIYSGLQSLNLLIAIPLFVSTPGILPSVALAAAFSIASATARPAWMWLISRVPDSRRGATMGFTATANQLGIMLGAALGGILVGPGSYGGVGVLAGAAALAAAILCRVGANMGSAGKSH